MNGENYGKHDRQFRRVFALPAALRQLLEGGETGLVDELVVIFQEDAAERLGLLGQALKAADYATVRREAHTIKGSALQVGANRVAEASRQVEMAACNPEPRELAALYRALLGSFEEVRGVIAARVAAPNGSPYHG